ncbi:hypothetical protein Agub_g673 [Astrephomene gubernaculifera]|uniref:Uncharacterized protein n=1 Tax=Astrephomene gubernaculifera TaxID=47775 RepID=A0AAD3DF42_9CHLO|nr:hypothetical protein Agub_g673 [Astrephomene gubernaculifera]
MAGTSTKASRTTQQQLQEENYSLRIQVSKLQVALRSALSQKGTSTGSGSNPAEVHVPKHQLDLILGELAALRQQLGQLTEENRGLQVQLREAQAASAAAVAGEGPWAASAPSPAAGQDRLTRGDMAFIEREIISLKQKINETRNKLQAAEPRTPCEGLCTPPTLRDLPPNNGPAAVRQGGPMAVKTGAVGVTVPQAAHNAPIRANLSRPSSIIRGRTAQVQANKKPTQPAQRPAKENRANPIGSVNPPVRGKLQRGRVAFD